ncbi:MAG TPA: phosphotransferase [Candidatus Omnitrophota bacterium]|nr:phosphotransferase [Candidatus Omnitrophota bacterium]HRY85173.1 phosphotransferase [Candidatus Omnitrophota bacterium]
MTLYNEEETKKKIAALLPAVKDLKIERLPFSGNNRLYLLTAGKENFIAKHYFTHAKDPRNRLHAEYSFASFAFQNGIACLPRPVARDDKNDLGIYSFLKGSKPRPQEIDQNAVKAALDFLKELNRASCRAKADLPAASEACFSIDDHLELIEKRIKRLVPVKDPLAAGFIRERLAPAWETLRKEILARAKTAGIKTGEELTPAEKIISPSDFGFHNALVGEEGRFYFLDFEYAGWDDPAKTAGDFFSQLALPVPVENLGLFARETAALTPDPAKTLARIYLLLRLYRLKWCCIALNHFLPEDGERRKFSGEDMDRARQEQLSKARKLLDSLNQLERKA